jgi:hypothetical protein
MFEVRALARDLRECLHHFDAVESAIAAWCERAETGALERTPVLWQ